MRLDIGDALLRIEGVAGRRAVVVDVGPGHRGAGPVNEPVVPQVAGQPDLDPVLVEQQPGQLLLGCPVDRGSVRVGVLAAGEALHPRVLVERPAPAYAVAQPVVEGADPGAGHLGLGRLYEAGVVRHLAEVPALAVHVDLAAVDPVPPQGQPVQRLPQLDHRRLRLVPHQVEPEAVHLVVDRPGEHRVDHQLIHHGVLGRRVGAAGGGLDLAGDRVQPVVVPGHHPVQDRLRVLPGGRRVVVDHVDHRPLADPVQALHHLPELPVARRPLRVRRVGALRGGVVQRVVAPVERVPRGDRGDAGLLRLAVRRERLQVAVRGLLRRLGPPRSRRCR